MVRILTCRNLDEYKREIFNGSIDSQLIDDVDKWDVYDLGDRFNHDSTIVGIFVHHESGSAWVVLKHDEGQMFEIEIDYDNGLPF